MCGISINRDQAAPSLSHRGIKTNKEQSGPWCMTFESLPLSSFGTKIEQPVKIGRWFLMFNGEIFNYLSLAPRAKSDVHYLVDLFSKFKSVEKFYKESIKWEGFWSICLIDPSGCVWFFTDPLGKKQLYHGYQGISSEIRNLTCDRASYSYTDAQFGTSCTPYRNIFRAIPGKIYCYDPAGLFAFGVETPILKYDEPNLDLYSEIERQVRLRVVNRMDGVSLLLSGGLDSNIILHHLLRLGTPVELVSWDNNERRDIERIVDHYGLSTRFIELGPAEPAFQCYEHPLDYGSLVPNFYLFKECSNRVVLTGDGSDEFFGGYRRALVSDTFNYDIMELQYYHNIRIDRTSMHWTKEARSPLMSNTLYNFAKRLPWSERRDKKILRDLYSDKLPFINQKKPLRHEPTI